MSQITDPLLGAGRKGLGCCSGACSGFRDFILRGDVVSLAVAVVVGNSFSALIDSFVADWLTPLVAVFFQGTGDFEKASFTLRGSVFKYGDFTNSAVTFLLNCLVVYFLVVLPMNALVAGTSAAPGGGGDGDGAPDVAPQDTRTCPECLSDIPCAARKCRYCASAVKPVPPQVVAA
ncbi:MAG: large conductance mechanosensitive channel protein [Monoraphidium minutum]|nr:MAG: large conductance mechanosensitive channel protein [Monoraphidium minutum]